MKKASFLNRKMNKAHRCLQSGLVALKRPGRKDLQKIHANSTGRVPVVKGLVGPKMVELAHWSMALSG